MLHTFSKGCMRYHTHSKWAESLETKACKIKHSSRHIHHVLIVNHEGLSRRPATQCHFVMFDTKQQSHADSIVRRRDYMGFTTAGALACAIKTFHPQWGRGIIIIIGIIIVIIIRTIIIIICLVICDGKN